MTHFLDLNTTARGDLRSIIDQAIAMKTARGGRPKGTPDDDLPLAGRMVALIFEKPSTRTRVSFDIGARQMGGQTMVLSGSEMQLRPEILERDWRKISHSSLDLSFDFLQRGLSGARKCSQA